jgi:hypothetical protein
MDSHDDDGGQWLTYAEIAAARGTSRLAAVRLAQRRRLRRQKGNDGFARVFVPADMLPDGRGDRDRDSDDTAPEPVPFHARALAALEDALAALREGHTREVAGLTKALAEAEAARDTARADHQTALEAVQRLEAAESARKARGRLRRAWDGWRGR